MPTDRETVTLGALGAILTARVAEHSDLAGAKISVQYALQQPDQEGCNWSDDLVIGIGPNANLYGVINVLKKLIPEVRAKYNVEI